MKEKPTIDDSTRNRELATRIKDILSTDGAIIQRGCDAVFEGVFNPTKTIQLQVILDRSVGEYYGKLPQNLLPPILLFHSWDSENAYGVTSPYGKTENQVVGPDGKLYFIENIYFLGKNDTATKLEKITCDTQDGAKLEKSLKDWEIDPNKVKRVEFIPDEKDSRHVELQEEDYMLIEDALRQIDVGNMKTDSFTVRARLGSI